MFKIIEIFVIVMQRFLLISSEYFFKLMNEKKRISWVVGVDEIAANVRYISESIPKSFSISFSKNKFYDFDYDFTINTNKKIASFFFRFFWGPVLLGRLINISDGFFYIGATRFLYHGYDEGKYEFKYLKRKLVKIVIFYTGSDIRSIKLSTERASLNCEDVIATYVSVISPKVLSFEFEQRIKKRANVSETYADLIFNASVDQISYFKKTTVPFIYFYPNRNFYINSGKYDKQGVTKIVHAPSSPIIKGTQLVRAAIAHLRNEGYLFEYIELIGIDNKIVLEKLRDAHIVLNEFYASVPGLFGVEAMANYCALITSADELVETDLPRGSNNAWLVTKYYQVYDNLKFLLDNPVLQKKYAAAGYQWACKYAAHSESGRRLSEILDSVDMLNTR